MTWIIDSEARGRLSAKLAAGLVISAMLALGTFAGSASAEERRGEQRRSEHREYHHYSNRGYYRAPPVVYGSQYGNSYYGAPYYPPPVVYGPGIGINLPGVSIGVR